VPSRKNDKAGLRFSVASDVGLVRERNEDNYLVLPEADLFVVADGMGGHASGDVASRVCVETVRRFYTEGLVDELVSQAWEELLHQRGEKPPSLQPIDFRLYKALEAANLAIYRAAEKYQKHRTMGTTIVAAQVLPENVLVGYVGDSRLYRLRNGGLSLLTEDHSLANEYLRLSLIRREDLPRFAYKNVIVRALGLADHVKVDIFRTDRETDDRLLLCSDGLTDLVPAETIGAILTEASTPDDACRMLVEFANDAGGHDNTTVVVLDIPPTETP
jgi:PPM family protein phosphatase